MLRRNLTLAMLAAAGASGCSTSGNTMLVFGQSQTVGITIGASATDQGADFTLGYRDKNFAIVPVTVRNADGSTTLVRSAFGTGFDDALSVLGQFELSTSSKTADVGLGKFFATGSAAKTLADGFRDKIRGFSDEKAPPPAAKASAPR